MAKVKIACNCCGRGKSVLRKSHIPIGRTINGFHICNECACKINSGELPISAFFNNLDPSFQER